MFAYNQVRIFAPATIANVGCGFDVMGLALNEPGDEIVATRTNHPGIRITKITGDDGLLPTDPQKNTAGIGILQLWEELGAEGGVEIEIHKKMPMGSGLGSSAASAVGGVAALNALLESPLSNEKLLPYALEGERIACGTPHADNAAASLFGGFVLVRSSDPVDVVPIQSPEDLFAAVLHPQIEILTEDTRRILRKNIPLSLAVKQWANVGGLIAGLLNKDYDLISRSLPDVVIEPIRSVLIPGFDAVKHSALDSGALGCSISGSGPSIFALCKGQDQAHKSGKAMQDTLSRLELESDLYISPVNQNGPQILERT